MSSANILELLNVSKRFPYVNVLDEVSFFLQKGKSTALVGASGSGKSTMLHIAALLEPPSLGEIFIDGVRTQKMSDKERTVLRKKHIGFVYQFHNLLPEFTSIENVMMPLIIRGVSKRKAQEQAAIQLEFVGLKNKASQFTNKLSGGEQQRIAIARALVTKPDIIIADEPTGNLDNKTACEIFELFIKMVKTQNASLLMATHNIDLAQQLDKQMLLQCGKIIADG
jgi:lipoprotein-releasing system ATP-binding protein